MPDIRVAERRSDNNLLLSFNPSSCSSFSITTRFVKKKKEKLLNFDLIGSDRLFLRFLHFPFPRRSKGKSEFLLRVSFLPVSRESLAGETNPSCQRKGTRVNRDEDQMSTARLNYSNYPRTKGWRKGEGRKGREESKLDDGRDGDRPVVRDNKLSLPRRYHVFSFRPGASLPPGPFLFVLLRAKPCRSFRRHAFNDVDGRGLATTTPSPRSSAREKNWRKEGRIFFSWPRTRANAELFYGRGRVGSSRETGEMDKDCGGSFDGDEWDVSTLVSWISVDGICMIMKFWRGFGIW